MTDFIPPKYQDIKTLEKMTSLYLARLPYRGILKETKMIPAEVERIIGKLVGAVPSYDPEISVVRNLVGLGGLRLLKAEFGRRNKFIGEGVRTSMPRNRKYWSTPPELLVEATVVAVNGDGELTRGSIARASRKTGLNSLTLTSPIHYILTGKSVGRYATNGVPKNARIARKLYISRMGVSHEPTPATIPAVETPKTPQGSLTELITQLINQGQEISIHGDGYEVSVRKSG